MNTKPQDDKDMPTDAQKVRAKELLDEFGRGVKNPKNLAKRVQKKAASLEDGMNLQVWKSIHEVEEGLSRNSIDKKRKGLELIEANGTVGQVRACCDNFHDLEVFLDLCKKTKEAALDFLSYQGSVPVKKTVLNEVRSSDLEGTQWDAFFLHYTNEARRSEDVNEGLIGRGIMDFSSNQNGTNVRFINTDTDNRRIYEGSYESFINFYRGYLLLNLKPADKTEYGRHIHAKLYCRGKNQDVLIGQYITYERGIIQSGNIVYKKIVSDKKLTQEECEKRAKSFSFIKNYEDYKEENVPEVYRRFLAERTVNFNALNLTDEINTEKKLLEYLRSHRDSEKKRFERFQERIKPRVFLSTPRSSTGTQKVEQLKENLEEVFEDKLQISYKVGIFPKYNERYDIKGSKQPYLDIEKLKTTRFFVLFLTEEPKQLSYSFLQLGVALTVCKVVVVIGKEKYLTNSINHLSSKIIKKIYIKEDLDSEFETISNKLIRVLKLNLPKHMNGYIDKL